MKYFVLFTAFLTLFGTLSADDDLSFADDQIEAEELDDCDPPTAEEESDLFTSLDQESKQLYETLDVEGKNRAVELSQIYEDKSIAIEDAAREMAKRQKSQYPNQEDYPHQLEETTGQNLYNNKYGS